MRQLVQPALCGEFVYAALFTPRLPTMAKRARMGDSPLSSAAGRRQCDSPLSFMNTPEHQSSTSEDGPSGNSVFPSQRAYFAIRYDLFGIELIRS